MGDVTIGFGERVKARRLHRRQWLAAPSYGQAASGGPPQPLQDAAHAEGPSARLAIAGATFPRSATRARVGTFGARTQDSACATRCWTSPQGRWPGLTAMRQSLVDTDQDRVRTISTSSSRAWRAKSSWPPMRYCTTPPITRVRPSRQELAPLLLPVQGWRRSGRATSTCRRTRGSQPRVHPP